MKRTDGKAENVLREHNSVSLTKPTDGDNIMLHEYYLHIKERIGQRHKDYYNNSKTKKKGLEAIVKNNSPKEELKNSCTLPKDCLHLFG